MVETKVYIDGITFNDNSSFNFRQDDIVVFTGPNNSGKSQVLRDIKNFFANKKIVNIIAKYIEPKFIGDYEYLASKCINRKGKLFISNISIGSITRLKDMWSSKDLELLHPLFINLLSTENRLKAANPVASFNAVEEYPNNSIQSLYNNDDLERTISHLFQQAYNEELIVNRGAGSKITLHVGKTPLKEKNEDRVSYTFLKKLKELPQIQEEGDGMRSYAGILLDTFTSKHSISLIDEPEAFLHPPQARLLGKMIVENTPKDRQLFISTHSEYFLKGLLDVENERIKIIHIERQGNINRMNMLNNEQIKKVWKDPILRYSNILSGLFHSKVVICESDTDCRFYQAVLDSILDESLPNQNILFTYCGGKQRLKIAINALKSLNVKTVAIADIDILDEQVTFKEIAESMDIKWDDINKDWIIIDEYVKSRRPQLNTEDVKERISTILEGFKEPQLTIEIGKRIKEVIKMSSAWSDVKDCGKTYFKGDAYNSFNRLYTHCKEKGLLIVHVGELESFYKPYSQHGVKWVYEVLSIPNFKNDPQLDSARKFVNEILSC